MPAILPVCKSVQSVALLLLVILICTMVTATPSAALAGDLVLVNKGKSVAPIIIPDNLPPRTRDVVDELALYIEKTTGAKPDIIQGAPTPIPAHAIWVGYQPALITLFPKTDFDFKFPEEILLITNDNHIAILGKDVYDPANSTIESPRGTLQNIQVQYGTANAIYTFIQDILNVRWLWPGTAGEDIDARETLIIKPFEYRYHPQIRGRGGLLTYSDLSPKSGYGKSQDWVRRQRLQYDSLDISGGHGFGDWWDKYHETHPEYFALQPDGTRTPSHESRNVKLCQSNPAVWDQWIANVEEELKHDPNQTIFNASPNDGYSSGICVCENCRAWDDLSAVKRRYTWKGKNETYVAMSDRYFTFANHLAVKLKERYPDKPYYVYMYSYGPSRPVPVHTKPAANVLVGAVANFILRDGLKDKYSPDGETFKQQFEAWGKIVTQMTWRPNIGSPVGWQQGLPDIDLTQTIKDFKLVGDSNVIAVFMDMNWEHWATQGPQNYLMTQLTWNLNADIHAIMNDYYQRGFGPAASTIKTYWQLMEDTRNQVLDDDGLHAHPIYEIYNDDFFKKANGLLDQANQEIASANSPKQDLYFQRIKFLRLGMDWSKLATQNMALMATINENKGLNKMNKKARAKAQATMAYDSPKANQARANYLKMMAIANDEAFPHAINWGPVRPMTPRGAGMYPGDASSDPAYMTASQLRKLKAAQKEAGKATTKTKTKKQPNRDE